MERTTCAALGDSCAPLADGGAGATCCTGLLCADALGNPCGTTGACACSAIIN